MMESDGGMVAVVQGLKDAGLAVTLLPQRYQPNGRSVLAELMGVPSSAHSSQPPAQASQMMVNSATETVVKDIVKDTMYKSSYQLAHCRPSGYWPERVLQYSVTGFQQIRSSTSRSPDEEAFIESLRKYPLSPTRSRSADLIERMLSYTNSKNGARYNTRSAKSLPSKEASKHLHSDEIPTRDIGITNNNLRPNFGYKRDVELIPVPTNNRKSRYDKQIEMYDYLKSNHKDKKLKGPEVRYLTNVKQCIRERLRQICDEDQTTLCPKIQNRYSQHRKQYHRTEVSQNSQKVKHCKRIEKCPTCKESMQDSTQNEVSPSTSKERKESNMDKSMSSFKNNKACFCDQPDACFCGVKPSRSILKPKFVSEDYKHKQCISICENECNATDDTYIKHLKKTILDWLQELPVYTNSSANDTMKREEIINQLIDSLSQIQRDNTYFDKVEIEIKKCLKVLPMWRPQNKIDQESFENQLAQSFLQKVKGLISEQDDFKNKISKWIDCIPFNRNNIDKQKIIDDLAYKLKPVALKRPFHDKNYKETLKSEITSTLNELPIEVNGSRSTVINNLADKLIKNLQLLPSDQTSSHKKPDIQNLVLDWIKNIPQISEDVNKGDSYLVNDLIMRLDNLKNKDCNDEIINEVTNWLNTVEEIKQCLIDRNTKNMLTTQLVNQLLDSHHMNIPQETLTDVVQKWFDDMAHTLGVHFTDNKKDLKNLATILQDLQTIENDENRQNIMQQEILKWLQNIKKKSGRYVDSGIQENLVNKLMSMIEDESKLQKSVSGKALITQNIWKWLESQPEFKQDSSLQYRDMVIELSEKLQDIKNKKGDLAEYDIITEVKNWFEKLSQERDIQVDANNQKKLQEKLLSSINTVNQHTFSKKPNNIKDLISKEVSDTINDSITSIKQIEKERLRDQIVKVIAQDWNTVHFTQTDELLSKIINILKQSTNLLETDITSLAHKIIDKVKKATSSNKVVATHEGPFIFDNTLKDKLKSEVENILKMMALTDKRQVIDTITDNLIKNYENLETDDGFKAIHEIFKKLNVSDSKAQVTTNKLLDITHKLRNEAMDTTYKSPSYGSAESLWMQKQMFMQRLEHEITDFMEKVLNEKNSFSKEKLSVDRITSGLEDSINRYDKFKNSPLKTSTPTKLKSKRNQNIESQYKNEMNEIIRNWIAKLKIDGFVDEAFKDGMANDIATDIIDRQRYLQISKTKRSGQEDIEHLKYQVFKWTSKLPDLDNLTATTSEIKMLIKSLEGVEIPNLLGETNKQVDSKSSVDYNGDVIIQDTEEFVEENIKGALWNWFNEIQTQKPRNSQDRHFEKDLITELSKKIKIILTTTEASNIENLCKDEIVNFLRKVNHEQNTSEEELQHTANVLVNYLKNLELFANNFKQSQVIPREAENKTQKKDAIKRAVQNWCQNLPLKSGKTYDDMTDIVDSLAEAVSRYLLITDMDNVNTFMEDILSNLRKLPLQFDKHDTKHLPRITENQIETLKGVLNDSEKYAYSSTQDKSAVQKPTVKKAAGIMYNNIQNWCENLPLDSFEEVNIIKQNIAGRLLKKIGELNLDPEIFHDDYLYENVLKDEIETVLNDLPKIEQLEEILPTLKQNLIKDLLEAKEAMKNEIAGFAYKQQLRDVISKTLSSIGLSITEETPFEVLKDNLADAFISLHYVEGDEELKNKFKEKIFNEVNKFCDDYLKRNPSSPLNAYQLNQELYNALKKVPVPKHESMRREVEQIRIKDMVTDWFKDLPLKETPYNIQENKIISILAKRLHEIENEGDLNLEINIDESMNNEILKWLKKFNLKSENEPSTEQMIKKLINKLKATKRSRKLDESTIRKSINNADLTSDLHDRRTYPASTLTAEDRAHLQRIKDRTSTEQPISKIDKKKDASVSPDPIATGIQTENNQVLDNNQRISQNASIQTINRELEPPTSITPQVIIKEFYWDTHGSPTMQRSGSILSGMQTPVTRLAGNIQQQAKITRLQEIPHEDTASQTMPLPASIGTITQQASIGQVDKTRIQNNSSVGTSTQNSCLAKATATVQQPILNEPEDDLHVNIKQKRQIKPCQPCRGRAVLTGDLDGINDENYWDDHNYINQPCFRRPMYQTPIKDVESQHKRKKKNQPCVCKNPMLTRCTIRPESPCLHSSYSNKSCYVAKKHCPKCWDGFCPHPSYLYFRQD